MNNTVQIERYLLGGSDPEEQLLMEARLLTEPGLRNDLLWQARTYELVNAYGRRQLRNEIRRAEARVFSESRFEAFRHRITHIFHR